MSALLIHESDGMVELHFHIFAALAFLLVYRDWRVPVLAAVVIAVHHLLLNFDPDAHFAHLLPHGHYGLPIVALHAIFVVFETAVLVFLSITLEREIIDLAEHRAREAAEREELSAMARRLAHRDLSVADEATRPTPPGRCVTASARSPISCARSARPLPTSPPRRATSSPAPTRPAA